MLTIMDSVSVGESFTRSLIESLKKVQQLLDPEEQTEMPAVAARLRLLSSEERSVLTGIIAGMPNRGIASSLRTNIRQVELSRVSLTNTRQVKSLSGVVWVAQLVDSRPFAEADDRGG
jgi:two-component system response regulator FixJ